MSAIIFEMKPSSPVPTAGVTSPERLVVGFTSPVALGLDAFAALASILGPLEALGLGRNIGLWLASDSDKDRNPTFLDRLVRAIESPSETENQITKMLVNTLHYQY